MIERRSFFGKVAAFFGFSILPGRPMPERWRRARQARNGLDLNDVRFHPVWDRMENGNLGLRLFVDCHGDTYGQVATVLPGEIPPEMSVVVTSTGIKSEPVGPEREAWEPA